MVQLVALRQLPRILALAVCTLAAVAFATPASARPHHHHRAGHHAHGHHHHHHVSRHHRHRHYARTSRWKTNVAHERKRVGELQRRPDAGKIFGWRLRIECRLRSTPLYRRKSDRPQPALVRTLHEHGPEALRAFGNRLRHGELIRALRAPDLRPAGRRHRRHWPTWRWPCRGCQRHRCARQSHYRLGQSWPSRRGVQLIRAAASTPTCCRTDALCRFRLLAWRGCSSGGGGLAGFDKPVHPRTSSALTFPTGEELRRPLQEQFPKRFDFIVCLDGAAGDDFRIDPAIAVPQRSH